MACHTLLHTLLSRCSNDSHYRHFHVYFLLRQASECGCKRGEVSGPGCQEAEQDEGHRRAGGWEDEKDKEGERRGSPRHSTYSGSACRQDGVNHLTRSQQSIYCTHTNASHFRPYFPVRLPTSLPACQPDSGAVGSNLIWQLTGTYWAVNPRQSTRAV